MASSVEQEYEVELEGERHYTIKTDERDWVQMEVMLFPDGAVLTKARFLVFNAMKRTKLYTLGWKRFNEEDCLSVKLTADEEDRVQTALAEEEDGDPLA